MNVHFIRFLSPRHHTSELESICFNRPATRPPWQKTDTHQPDLRTPQVAEFRFRYVAARSPWWTGHYEILTLHKWISRNNRWRVSLSDVPGPWRSRSRWWTGEREILTHHKWIWGHTGGIRRPGSYVQTETLPTKYERIVLCYDLNISALSLMNYIGGRQ